MINMNRKQETHTTLQRGTRAPALKTATLDKHLRKKRSKEYVDAMMKLDAGGGHHSDIDSICEQIASEFPELEIGGILLGVVSKCYLGKPYEVHTLDISMTIIQHYKTGESLPPELEKARSLANNPSYAFIEVYTDRCCAVDSRGNVSVIMG